MDIKEVFSKRLKALREAIGISQEDFAKALGMARATISYYEGAHRTPDIAFLQTLVEKTGCSVDYLMGYSDNMKPLHSDLGLFSGLSDRAIDALGYIEEKDTLNFLLEHGKFPALIRILKILSMGDFYKSNLFVDDQYREYKLFQAISILREISNDSCIDPSMEKFEKNVYIGKQNKVDQHDLFGVEEEGRRLEIAEFTTDSDLKLSRIKAESETQKAAREREYEEMDEDDKNRMKNDPIYRFYRLMTGFSDHAKENEPNA